MKEAANRGGLDFLAKTTRVTQDSAMNWLRDNWQWPFGTFCGITAALMIGYMIWVQYDIPENITRARILQIGVVRLPCGEKHFWGNNVLYQEPGRAEHWGRACRDWFGQKWVLNDDKPLH